MAVTDTPQTNLQRLRALEVTVSAQAERLAECERVIAGLRAVFGGGGSADAATDRELDGQYGDGDVKFIPRDWTSGGVVKGQKFSRCPADFLEVLAEAYDVFARRNDEAGAKDGKGRPKSTWDKKSARLARGWARRIRDGWTPPEPVGLNGARPGMSGFGSGGGLGGERRTFGSGGGFGAPREVPPPAQTEERVFVDPGQADELAEDDADQDISFPHGANLLPKTEENDDDDPPLAMGAGRL